MFSSLLRIKGKSTKRSISSRRFRSSVKRTIDIELVTTRIRRPDADVAGRINNLILYALRYIMEATDNLASQ